MTDIKKNEIHYELSGYNRNKDFTGIRNIIGHTLNTANGWHFIDQLYYTVDHGSINDGYLEINSQTSAPAFPDVPAAYLGGDCAFSYADGHAQTQKWVTKTLLTATGHSPNLINGNKNVDWEWFSQVAAANPP